ncbi:MAG: type II 3-dehydroquinate dehydratase [Clostridia bacterium]|nr:type II 3-dehydroquinate dehydratase [Clostridia bacterium]
MKKILVINGPNLNMLGIRERNIYGSDTLDSINAEVKAYAETLGMDCDFFQSNCEGEIITKIHTVLTEYDGCIINAGAYTHYSYAIRDAIECVKAKPFIEVHMSDIKAREEFRRVSVITEVCKDIIAGFGKDSYKLAVKAIGELI